MPTTHGPDPPPSSLTAALPCSTPAPPPSGSRFRTSPSRPTRPTCSCSPGSSPRRTPVVVPPQGVNVKDFRDPTTAWYMASEDAWLVTIGSKNDVQRHAEIVLVYKTADFLRFELLPDLLHAVEGTRMWECVDFFLVATEEETGLDTSEPAGDFVKHVLKVSLDDDRNDYYAIGTYDAKKNEWVPDDPEKDVGISLRYDYDRFYASKTFFDPVMKRRILLGWISESDSERADAAKGWASLMLKHQN
ncbi:hypothetical protein ZIOFF_024939 [Zingiber officinale]|uniref:Glycosyl hydrolase family 32 N-terminal domain-containing protein n=1 Tax=Zingiber officinale TaxID=94328 RepID=A0A8J5H0X9_ZINOF|nr:hypothetical protein ZIOFF_024939 [Zingiber officinale]